MLRLNLARDPYWLELGQSVRVQVAPLSTALMVAARSDPALRAVPDGTSDDEMALVFARAIAQRAVLDWEGVGDADGNAAPLTPDGITALLDIWPIFERFQMDYVAKGLELELEKTPPRPRRLDLWRGRQLLRRLRAPGRLQQLRGRVPGLPASNSGAVHL